MNKLLLLEYQRHLIFAALDEVTGYSIMKPDDHSVSPVDFSWFGRIKVANFLYRNLSCDLLRFNPMNPEIELGTTPAAIGERFFGTPYIFDDHVSFLLWNVVYFGGTDDLSQLLERHGLLNWDSYTRELVPSFAEEIVGIYKDKKFNLNDIL